jgi:hypothetical protein
MVDPPPPAPIPPPILPTLPTAFETRNIGLLLEAEVTADEAQKDVDLRLVPQHVALAERWNWGKSASEVQQPIFESRHLNTMTTVRVGVPCLLGTMSPPPASKVDPNRIWFAFVTVTTFKK